jgi:hypothetical protein
MTEQEAIGRVRRGAELLDRNYPGWAAKVPADERLRMKLADRCVLGWLYGHFATGMRALSAPGALWSFEIGARDYADAAHAYRLLGDAWRAAIRARGGGLPRPTEGSPCSS